jgi:thiopurine S-methyltransferase
MNHGFWHDRWQKGEIGFHRGAVNDLLVKHWPALGLAAGSQVFVPLCGKSLDMVWLAERGHRVVGVELSEVAVDAFFAERGLAPSVELRQGFSVKSSGAYEIWCGDFFDFPREAVARAAAVYDRAALVAFPRALQPKYATHLAAIAPASAPILLIGLDFAGGEMTGPPFPASTAEIVAMFGATHTVSVVEARDGLEQSQNLKARGLKRLEESVYLLSRK